MFDWPQAPTIRGGAIVWCSPDWSWDHVGGSTGFNLWFIYRGTGWLISGDKTCALRPGDCFLIRMWEPQQGRHDPAQTLVVPFILFDILGADGQSLNPRKIEPPPLHFRVRDIEFFYGLIERSLRAFEHQQTRDAETWLLAALSELREAHEHPPLSGAQGEQYERIEQVCRLIREKPAQRWSVRDLADACHYSTDHFIRLFRKFKRVTPGEFIIRIRLHEADKLLLFSNYTITQIAETLGYSDEFCFSHQFRQRRSFSPLQYRQALLQNKAPEVEETPGH